MRSQGILVASMPMLLRYAGYAPFFVLPAIIAALQSAAYPFRASGFDLAWELGCLLLSLLGVLLRLWTAGVTHGDGGGDDDAERRPAQLDTDGPYSLVRHPIQVANSLIVMGLIGFAHNWMLSVSLILLLVIYLDRAIARQDRLLERKFRADFAEWAKRTPRFVPKLLDYRPARRRFDERKALRQEIHWICAVFAAFFFMDSIEDLILVEKVQIDPAWTPPLVLSGVLSIAVRLYGRPSRTTASPAPPRSEPIAKERPAELIAAKDLVLLVGLAVMTVVSWITPQRLWRRLGRAIGPLAARMVSQRGGAGERIRRMIGSRAAAMPADAILGSMFATYVEDVLQVLRIYAPWGWRPDMRLLGEEHIKAALDSGRGVVLWVGYFTFRNVVTKMALHEAGVATSHLIHWRHGFSSTRFGRRFLNPIRTSAEGRYLKENVTLSRDGPRGAMRLLRRRLLDNGAISLTARESGSRPVTVPLLAGRIDIATGGPDLAYATNAILLPVFTIRRATGEFDVRVEAPLEADRRLPRRDWSAAVVRRYAERLEPYVVAYPDQWCGWEHV